MEFDYRKLLVTYMKHVINMEGYTYINNHDQELKDLGLNDKEIEELVNLSYETNV